MAKKAKGLGRGLSALLGDQPATTAAGVVAAPAAVSDATNVAAPEAAAAGPQMVPVEFLLANPKQPRQEFDEEALADLAASIKKNGLLQPILVRPLGDNRYEIVAGERRWRAAQRAQLHDVPVVVRELDDKDVLALAIIENVQREDLNPLEEAASYQRLIDEFGHKQNDVAEIIGKSRSHIITNLIRLLKLPEDVQAHVRSGALSMGHARALLTASDAKALAAEVMQDGLSVRETERRAKGGAPKTSKPGKAPAQRGGGDADTRALERDLAAALGLNVSIRHKGEAGEIVIDYKTLEQLDDVCQRLCGG